MAENKAAPPAQALIEQPTSAARLRISAEPAWVKVTTPWCETEDLVPVSQERHLITTFGLMGSAVTGAAAAVLTLRIDPRLGGLAVIELIFAAVVAVLITACGYRRDRVREVCGRRQGLRTGD